MTTHPVVGRDSERDRLQSWLDRGIPLISVWGLPGIGKSALVRDCVGADWTWFDATAPDAELPRTGPVVWDGADAERARQAWSLGVEGPVIVVGREKLDLEAEHALELSALDAASSIEVLAAAVERTGGELAYADAERLAEHLEGLPLALVRAARWLDVAGVDELLADPGLAWRGPRDVPPGHDSLRTALERGWARLQPSEQDALVKLSTLNGPITLVAASSLLGASARDHLRRLRDTSWLVPDQPGRLRMLRLVRVFVSAVASDSQRTTAEADFRSVLYGWSEPAWLALDRRGHAVGPLADHLADVAWALREDPLDDLERPGLIAALSLLSVLEPGGLPVDVLIRIEQLQGLPVDGVRALARVHASRGDVQRAEKLLGDALGEATDTELRGVLHRELGVFAHRRRDLDAARTHYEQAIEAHTAVGDSRGLAIAQGNLAAIDHDLGDLDAAAEHYHVALDALRGLGDIRLQGIFLSNLGALEVERERLADAREALGRGVGLLASSPDARLRAIARGNLGWLAFVEGRLGEAERRLREALADVRGPAAARTEALLWARLAAVASRNGEATEGLGCIRRAEQVLAGTDDRLTRRIVELFAGFVDLALGAQPDAAARIAASRLPSGDAPPLVSISDDARNAVRMLERALIDDPGPVVCMNLGEAWVSVEGARASLERHLAAQRLLRALATARVEAPGSALDMEALFAQGWPDERIRTESMRNRVHVALNKLRGSGLRAVLERIPEGYRLSPSTPILLVGG